MLTPETHVPWRSPIMSVLSRSVCAVLHMAVATHTRI
jgi:hypothetical protein